MLIVAGSVIVVTGISDYVVDAYSKYAGSCMGIIATGESRNAARVFSPVAMIPIQLPAYLLYASTT
jgi:hypothetical protein